MTYWINVVLQKGKRGIDIFVYSYVYSYLDMIDSEDDGSVIWFIDSLMENTEIPCMDLDPIRDEIFSENTGKLKTDVMFEEYKTIINVSWNKDKFIFKCSIIVLEEIDGKWEIFTRWDDAHGFRHMDMDEMKMPMGTKHLIECPIFGLIIDSLPEDRAKEWKKKMFEKLVVEGAIYEKWQNKLVSNCSATQFHSP